MKVRMAARLFYGLALYQQMSCRLLRSLRAPETGEMKMSAPEARAATRFRADKNVDCMEMV
jgi:hypothetical protein